METLLSSVDLKKDYKVGETTVHALRGVSMEVEKGEFTAIAGPSGSGKSTLLNLIGCLDTPTDGKVFINDLDLANTARKNWPTYAERISASYSRRLTLFLYSQPLRTWLFRCRF